MSSLSRRTTGLAERLSASGRPGVSSDLLVVPSDHTSVSTSHRPRDYYLRRLLAVTDVVALVLAAVLAAYLPGAEGFGDQLPWFLLTLPVWVALFGAYGLYGGDLRRVSHSTVDDLPGIFHAFLIGSVVLWGYFQITGHGKVVFLSILGFGLAAMALMIVLRRTARGAARRVMGPERVLFVGGGLTTAALVQKMRTLENGRLEPVGVLVRYDDPPAEPSVPVIGRFDLSRLEAGAARAQHRSRGRLGLRPG